MHRYHQEIVEEIKKVAVPQKHGWFNKQSYIGSTKPAYSIPNAKARAIAKTWVKNHQETSLEECIKFLDSLYKGESHNERTFGGFILEYFPKLRKQLNPSCISRWLTRAEGWLEVDSLCQSSFTAQEILEKWEDWEKEIKKLVVNKDVHKRRASLVLLTKATRQSPDSRLADLAFENVDKLKREKDILITKAISWLLRSLIAHHSEQVRGYLKKNEQTLPKIALRETTRKLNVGKK